jgi:acetate kinase
MYHIAVGNGHTAWFYNVTSTFYLEIINRSTTFFDNFSFFTKEITNFFKLFKISANNAVRLNRQSGILGISGVSSDFRDLEAAANNGDERSQLAIDIFAYKVRKYIGGYVAAMGGVDAIVLTAGLGENSPFMREKISNGLEYLGTRIDPELNKIRGKASEISIKRSRTKIFVVPTNEELVIARDTKRICGRLAEL